MIDSITSRFWMLAENPGAGRAEPEAAPNVRCFPAGQYLIYYSLLQEDAPRHRGRAYPSFGEEPGRRLARQTPIKCLAYRDQKLRKVSHVTPNSQPVSA
jgi:hypothetical protein